MHITLRSVRIYPRLSEETTCYEAIVCIDGKPAFSASNRGTGSGDSFDPLRGADGQTFRASLAAARAYAAGLPPHRWPDGRESASNLDLLMGQLLAEHEVELARRKFAANRTRGSHLYLVRDGQLFTIKRRSSLAVTAAEVAAVSAKHAGRVLNLEPDAWLTAKTILFPAG